MSNLRAKFERVNLQQMKHINRLMVQLQLLDLLRNQSVIKTQRQQIILQTERRNLSLKLLQMLRMRSHKMWQNKSQKRRKKRKSSKRKIQHSRIQKLKLTDKI